MPQIEMDQVKLMQELTIEVKLVRAREMRVRLWLAARLIKLACWITGMGLIMHDDDGQHGFGEEEVDDDGL